MIISSTRHLPLTELFKHGRLDFPESSDSISITEFNIFLQPPEGVKTFSQIYFRHFCMQTLCILGYSSICNQMSGMLATEEQSTISISYQPFCSTAADTTDITSCPSTIRILISPDKLPTHCHF